MIKLKRVYEEPQESDGYRILIDRLWPRGLSKEKAKVDEWIKDIAPSNELRRWFHHDREKWKEFQEKYKAELKSQKELIEQIKNYEKEYKTVTLLFSAKDSEHNNAVVLKSVLS